MEYMDKLKDKLCEELEEIARKSELSAGDLEMVHKLTDTIKNIDKIDMLEDSGYSQAGDWEARGNYSRNSYNRGSSYANRGKHYVRGHYSRDGRNYSDGYSRHDAKERMLDHLDDMMQEASTDKERDAIRRCMAQIENA